MPASRITCPDCKTVLRPAKPVPDGKKVKCPECGNVFTTPGLVGDDDEPPKKKPARKKEAVKKAPESAPPSGKPAYNADEEESDGGTYRLVSDGDDEKKDEDEEDKPQIDYAPDLSIKDLRGPAQEAVVKPSNYMMLISGLSLLCNIVVICVLFWPMVFSEYIVDYQDFLERHYKTIGTKEALERAKNLPKERKDLKEEELELLDEATTAQVVWRIVFMIVYALIIAYNAVIIVGAVKMQNLESRGWGIAASIMTLLPFTVSGIGAAVSFVFFLLMAVLLDDPALGMLYAGGGGVLAWIIAILVGVWSLRTLMDQKVIDGFEYKPD